VVPRFSSTRAALRHPSWLVPASSLKQRGGTEANEQLEDGNMRGGMACCLSVMHHGAHWQWCRGEEISPALAGGLGLDAAGLGLHRAPTRVSTDRLSISAKETPDSVNGAPSCSSSVAIRTEIIRAALQTTT
jgi:hypothetical protein